MVVLPSFRPSAAAAPFFIFASGFWLLQMATFALTLTSTSTSTTLHVRHSILAISLSLLLSSEPVAPSQPVPRLDTSYGYFWLLIPDRWVFDVYVVKVVKEVVVFECPQNGYSIRVCHKLHHFFQPLRVRILYDPIECELFDRSNFEQIA